MLNHDACIDIPDARDFKFRDVFLWAHSMKLPRKVFLNISSVQNQYAQQETHMWCVFYTAAHIINEENKFEFLQHGLAFEELDARDVCKMAADMKYLDITKGAKLQSGPRLARRSWYISGSTLVNTLDEYRQACAKRQPVQIGTKKIDWDKTRQNNGIIVPGESYWHSLMGAGYDDEQELVFIRDSSWPDVWNKGYLSLRYADWDILYQSKYAYVDASNADTILAYQKKIRLNLAHERWYWNRQRPNDFATRYECSVIANKVSAYYQTNPVIIWNGKDENKYVVISEVQAMFERASWHTFDFIIGNPWSTITRSDLAALSVRI